MGDGEFFEEPEVQSMIKSALVVKYFDAWSKVMLGTTHRDKRIAYVDLFCGPGEYDDGTPSTPMRLLEIAAHDNDLATNLIMIFNDKDPHHTAKLEALIGKYPMLEAFATRPEVVTLQVEGSHFDQLAHIAGIPALYFIDPYGYKGLSLHLIGQAIRGWGCDCILFFNYNRINAAVSNPVVEPLMVDLFGERRFRELQAELAVPMTSEKRQNTIVSKFAQALGDVSGAFVLPFEFESTARDRTSHYLFLVTKHFRGYSIMKDIMYGQSTDEGEVRRFLFVPSRTSQLGMFSSLFDPDNPYSISVLKKSLQSELTGRVLRVGDIYPNYSVGTPYVEKNFKTALLEMEQEGTVTVDIPADRRRRYRGRVTLGDDRVVTFK